MKIITIYELLGMVKDGKAPKKIKYENREYYLYDNKSYLTTGKTRFFDRVYFSDLNVEVEILEEEKKIPEKLSEDNAIWEEQARDIDYYFKNTINDIIDYLQSKGDE